MDRVTICFSVSSAVLVYAHHANMIITNAPFHSQNIPLWIINCMAVVDMRNPQSPGPGPLSVGGKGRRGCSGTKLWAPFGDWGSPCGRVEASELQVTPAFLPAFFLSYSHPSSAPIPAQGQKGAAAQLLECGERLVVKLRGPTSWQGPQVSLRVLRNNCPPASGRGGEIPAEYRVLLPAR